MSAPQGKTSTIRALERDPSLSISTGYLPIHLAELQVNTMVDFDLYLQVDGAVEPVLYRDSNLPFAEDTNGRLLEHGVETLYIREEDEEQYYRYLENNLRTTLLDEGLTLQERTSLLYDTSLHVVKDFLENPKSQELMPRTEQLMSNIVYFLLKESNPLYHFLKVGAFDYKMYTHSVNVTMYSLTLAQRLGQTDPAFLHQLGTGALLHDIGKSLIPRAVLEKKTTLTAEEWEMIKQHPQWGCDILREQGVTNDIIHGITMSHHEKLDGSGYPWGLKKEGIEQYVRIVTISDIFDALTTRRVYNGAATTFIALSMMREEMHDEIDQDIFREFVMMMSDPSTLAPLT